jgi:hypothetical protein
VSNHFAGQLAHAKAEIQSRFIAGLSGQTALSAASLRVEMETAKHQAREAQQEIRSLKARLARTLGEEVAGKHPEHSVSSATVKDLHAQVEQLLVAQGDLRRQLRDSEEELEASRRLNRTLIREGNSNATERPLRPRGGLSPNLDDAAHQRARQDPTARRNRPKESGRA